jgi:hypothetical protein
MTEQKKTTLWVLLLLLTGSSALLAESLSGKITIMDKGVKRIIPIPQTESDRNQSSNTHTETATALKEGVIVKFKTNTPVNIKAFEQNYGLKLKRKLRTGYYIFTNPSDSSDVAVLNHIMQSDKTVETVKPNWRLQNQIR